MKNFRQWLRNIGHWLRRMPVTRHYWWAGAVVLCAVAAVWGFAWSEDAFRIAGIALQLGGVLTVVWGILKTREDFNQEPIRHIFQRWLSAFPKRQRRTVSAEVSGSWSVGTNVSSSGAVSTGPAPDQSVDARLARLEGLVNGLQTRLSETRNELRQAEKKAQQALDEQGRQLVNQIGEVAKKIEETAIGGVHVSAVGVILLFVGTVLGGFGPELHRLFGT
jgi:hypothetical protein